MKKFKKNLEGLLELFKTKDELIGFLIEKKAFNENFVKNIIDIKNIDILLNSISLNEIKSNIHYDVFYKDDKINVDITTNDVFSYLDTEEELRIKMKKYIKIQDYDKAATLKNYLNTIDVTF